MIFLLLSIFCSTAVYLLFKKFESWQINLLPAITMNYFTASILGLLVIPDWSLALNGALAYPSWFGGGLVLGFFFISVFYLMATATQRIGVTVTTVASKMSLVVAMVLFVVIRPEETWSSYKVVAMILAMSGVIFTSLRLQEQTFEWRQFLWPIIILLGSTIVDFGVAYFSKEPKNESELALYGCLSFMTSAVCGLLLSVYSFWFKRKRWHYKDLLAGVALGAVNYGTIFFLIKAYNTDLLTEPMMLSVYNLSVIVLCSVGAILFFKESLSRYNYLGVALSVIAIYLLSKA